MVKELLKIALIYKRKWQIAIKNKFLLLLFAETLSAVRYKRWEKAEWWCRGRAKSQIWGIRIKLVVGTGECFPFSKKTQEINQ